MPSRISRRSLGRRSCANAQNHCRCNLKIDSPELSPDQIDTNIVIFQVDPGLGTAEEFAGRLKEQGVSTMMLRSPLQATFGRWTDLDFELR